MYLHTNIHRLTPRSFHLKVPYAKKTYFPAFVSPSGTLMFCSRKTFTSATEAENRAKVIYDRWQIEYERTKAYEAKEQGVVSLKGLSQAERDAVVLSMTNPK